MNTKNEKEKFDGEIMSDKLTLVDFYAAWCGPCKAMHPILEQLSQMVGDKARILKYDVDDLDNSDIVARYNVSSVPTLILFSRGKVLWRTSGVVSAEYLRDIVEKFEHSYAS